VEVESALRKTAVALLLVGFGWLCWQQVGLLLVGSRPGLRVLLEQLDAQPNATYTKAEVERLGREAVSAQSTVTPLFAIPGSFMLLGGLLAGWSARPRNGDNAA
jgi:hypothetical protein